jgi:hypothetical protein
MPSFCNACNHNLNSTVTLTTMADIELQSKETSGQDDDFAVEEKINVGSTIEIVPEIDYMSGWKLHVLTFG